MIDFFVKEAIDDEDASLLLQYVFNLAKKDIVICSWEYLENNDIAESCKCLAIKVLMEGGDASTLLQLWIIKIPLANFLEKLQSFCDKKSITCFVTSENNYPNSYYNYYKITPNCAMIEVSEWLKEDNEGNEQIYFYDTPLKVYPR